VSRQFGYLGWHGELQLETDDGEVIYRKDTGRRLVAPTDAERISTEIQNSLRRAPQLVGSHGAR
jgi:hypothetical protein